MKEQNDQKVEYKHLTTYKKAKKKYSKAKTPYEVYPYLTVSRTDLNWFLETIKKLEIENYQLKKQVAATVKHR
ncbi:hypothetical protein B4134_0525 [Bacillus safensis]|uniref:hypothetical protein n=1 Tax=Bacillus safensis TaxID=561879 RepID=UPI0005974E5D|nr:hypothetical protein [Bacillus safensis]KIL25109.1 hypothetical protein B4134_0525 [Bacillus safensis]